METIRCLVCQGQSIADSDAEMAGDMRSLIRTRIAAGESPEQIRAWLISRYGDWVTYDPPLEPVTWPLWAAPVAAAPRRPVAGARPLQAAEAALMGWLVMIGCWRSPPARGLGWFLRARQGRAAIPRRRACCSRSPAMPGRGSPGCAGAPEARRRRARSCRKRDFAKIREDDARPLRPRRRLAEHGRELPARAATTHGAAELLQSAVAAQSAQTPICGSAYGNALVASRRRDDEPGRPARLRARRRGSRPTIRRRASSTASRWRRAAISTRPSGSGASLLPAMPPTRLRRLIDERLQRSARRAATGGRCAQQPPRR